MAKQTILQGHDICVLFYYDGAAVPTYSKIADVRRVFNKIYLTTETGCYNATMTAEQFASLIIDGSVSVGGFEFSLIND